MDDFNMQGILLEICNFNNRGVEIPNFSKMITPVKTIISIDESKYFFYGSSGTGRAAKVMWIGIFNYSYYKNAYYNKKISASRGLYIVYLINIETKKVYLSLSYASDNMSEYREKLPEINRHFRDMIDKKVDKNILRSIKDKLSSKSYDRPRRYEQTSIYAKEYDLENKEYSNSEFRDDYKYFQDLWLILYEKMKDEDVYKVEDYAAFIGIDKNSTLITKELLYSEKEAINNVNNYFKLNNFIIKDQMLFNFYLSLKTKPFVILAGVSGTGKSKFASLFADAISAEYKMIPVKPDWTDSTDLFGHKNLQGKFVSGPVTEFIYQANNNPDKPYILCLDEMNLARVEYYFSDFLSIIETIDSGKSKPFFSEGYLSDDDNSKYQDIHISDNLYIVGTVNMDETTYAFSKKVLDRAFTIEFSDIELDFRNGVNNSEEVDTLDQNILNKDINNVIEVYDEYKDTMDDVVKVLDSMNKILKDINSQVAYRVRDEIAMYMVINEMEDILDEDLAMDYCIMQKILPRIQGSSNKVRVVLIKLLAYLSNQTLNADNIRSMEDLKDVTAAKYNNSFDKVKFMLERFFDDGFTSYWL